MPHRLSFPRTFCILENVLRVTQKRHHVITSNISNLDTPGYRARDIDFKSALERAVHGGDRPALATTHAAHMRISAGAADAEEPEDAGEAFDGVNWVDLDQEMKKLTENRLLYQAAVEVLMRKVATLKTVISDGGR